MKHLSSVFGSLVFLWAISPFARAQCQPQWLPGDGWPGAWGPVHALVEWDADGSGPKPKSVVACGEFTVVGRSFVNGIAAIAESSVDPLGGGLGDYAKVYCAAVLPDGRLIAGGNFVRNDDANIRGIAIWDGTKWNSLGSGIAGAVYSILPMPDGTIVVGGDFTSAGGVSASRIARWTGTSWNPVGAGFSSTVTALINDGPAGSFIAGGLFTRSGTQTLSRIARWNGASWLPVGSGINGSVYTLSRLLDGRLVAGGNFSTAGTQAASCLAAWNGTAWSSISPTLTNPGGSTFIRGSMVGLDGQLVIVGSFQSVGPLLANGIARWDGSNWSAFGDGIQGIGRAAIETASGAIVVGGEFPQIGDTDTSNLACWLNQTWTALVVSKIAPAPTSTAPAGTRLHLVNKTGLFDGVRWTGLPVSRVRNITATAQSAAGEIYAAGDCTPDGGPEVRCLVRLVGGEWSFFAPGGDEAILRMTTDSAENIYAIGAFQTIGGVQAPGVARWSGTSWVSMGSGFPEGCTAISAIGPENVVVASTDRPPAHPRYTRVSRWNGSSWTLLGPAFEAGATPKIEALLAAKDGTIFSNAPVAGPFGDTVDGIARWDGVAWKQVGLPGDLTGPFGPYGASITVLAQLPSGDIIAAGTFGTPLLGSCVNVARWNGTSWLPMDTVAYGISNLDVISNSEVVVATTYRAGPWVSMSTGRWVEVPKPWVAYEPGSANVLHGQTISISSTPATGYSNVSFQWKRETTPGVFIDVMNGPGGSGGVGGNGTGGTVSGANGLLASPTDGTAATLTITNAQPSDAGSYAVVFSNSCGSVTSQPAVVTIESACPSDLNNDGLVDDADLSVFAVAYDVLDCAAPGMPAGCPADLNRDGLVNDDDFQVFVVAYNEVLCP
ncbi:MAG: hypothetical protein K2Y21_06380 [Phycisphaerales bacterium]|nr:hypothetical protein [Phycisphaerales bacterium]